MQIGATLEGNRTVQTKKHTGDWCCWKGGGVVVLIKESPSRPDSDGIAAFPDGHYTIDR